MGRLSRFDVVNLSSRDEVPSDLEALRELTQQLNEAKKTELAEIESAIQDIEVGIVTLTDYYLITLCYEKLPPNC